MKDQEIAEYFHRVGLGTCRPDLEGLTILQKQHMINIPFENLDIVVGREISLDYRHLFEKLIVRKRGGYCFELNTLYATFLEAIGFTPKPVLGRVWLSNPKATPPRNHLAHIVELEGRTYITDVGFGGLIARKPLDIHESTPVKDKDGMVRVIPFADDQFMIQRQTEKDWTNLYSFETVEISEEDISISNYYMSTHPDSHFYSHKFAGRNTEDGRIALFNNKMSIRKGTKVVDKKRVAYGEEWLLILNNDFSINLDFSEKEISVLLSPPISI